MGRLQVPISRAAGIPWGSQQDRDGVGEGGESPMLMGTGPGAGSKKAGTRLNRVMVPNQQKWEISRD